jgi:hypothetical protein
MLRDSQIPNDLNVGISQRISVALAFIITGIAVAASLMHAQIFLAPSVALLFLMLAAYEVELTTARRFKGTIATALLIAILAVTSFWSDQPLIFAVSVLAFLLLLLRRHYYSPEHRYRRPIAILAGLILVTAIIFVASQPGAHLLHVLFLAAGGVFIVLNARFYALLASKRGRLFSIAAIPFHVLFFLYSGVAFLIGVARHFFRTRCDTGDHRLATRRHWRL